jgi:hypothetical protein
MTNIDGDFLIGIPTYNGHARVEALLQNLRQRTPADIKHTIVVCDDSGKASHQQLVRTACEKYGASYIQNDRNRGVPASWNALVQSKSTRYAILLNDDVLVANGWLKHLGYALANNPQVGSFSMNCLFITQSDVSAILAGPDAQAIPLNVHYRDEKLIRDERFPSMPLPGDGSPGRVMCPAGCFFGFRREMYDAVGGFDEQYFAFYEELDFGVACAAKGFPTFTLPVPHDNYHLWSATFATAPEINAGKVMAESRQKFVWKWSAILGVRFSDAPEIHNLLMDKIPKIQVKWIGLDGSERSELL